MQHSQKLVYIARSWMLLLLFIVLCATGCTGEVQFADPNLEAAIREALNRPEEPITDRDLVGLTELNASERGISDLTGIQHCTDLQSLGLYNNQISDISPLSSLVNLRKLYLVNNKVSDIAPLKRLTNLQELHLHGSQVSDLTPLTHLTNLQGLDLVANKVSDISVLSGLTNLQSLWLNGNQISDITVLSRLTKLQTLWLRHNRVSDISPLGNLTNLEVLYLGDNQITDISPLRGLTNLVRLGLPDNQVSDIGPLNRLTNLQWLSVGGAIDGNQISDISPVADLTDLRVLYLARNRIQDISPLEALTKIGERGRNGVLSHGVTRIHLRLWHNRIDDISPLVNNSGIGAGDGVDLRGNPLNDEAHDVHIPALQKRGVELLSDPKSEPVTVDPSAPGLIKGQVTDTQRPNPGNISNATVTVENETLLREARTTKTDSAGNYEVTNLPPGEYIVRVSKPGYKDSIEYVTVVPGGDAFHYVRLSREE